MLGGKDALARINAIPKPLVTAGFAMRTAESWRKGRRRRDPHDKCDSRIELGIRNKSPATACRTQIPGHSFCNQGNVFTDAFVSDLGNEWLPNHTACPQSQHQSQRESE